jgi:hypothetical protein
MHRLLFGAIVIILLLLLTSACRNESRQSSCRCTAEKQCDMCREKQCGGMRYRLCDSDNAVNNDRQRGLSELQQTPRSRGLVPGVNQPDHISNLWKCDQSHPKIRSDGQYDTSFGSDYPTYIRGAVVNMQVEDVSGMHLTRFGAINSV